MVSILHLNLSPFPSLYRSPPKVSPKDRILAAQQILAPQIAISVKSFSSRKSTPGVRENDSQKSTLGGCENDSEESAPGGCEKNDSENSTLGVRENDSEESTLGVCENDSEKSTLGVCENDSEKSTLGVCENDSEKSFTVSYLMNSCGLSSKDAIAASDKVQLESPEKPDAVLKLLREYGFEDAHIPTTVIGWPQVLVTCPNKILLPKLEFFRSIGVPVDALANTVSRHPYVLQRSLENSIIPSYNHLKDLLKTDERVVRVFLLAPDSFINSPNISMLRERGVPKSTIVSLVRYCPLVLGISKERLAESVDRAVKMGFDPSKSVFVHAVQVFVNMTESSLKRKMDLYRRCGWSDSDIATAFLKSPLCMMHSDEKVVANMDFLVNEIGCAPADIAANPTVVGYSLEKRIKPRLLVAKILDDKGLKKMLSASTLLCYSEDTFLKKYIYEYENDIPELLDIYEGKLSPGECVSVSRLRLTEVNANRRKPRVRH